MVLHAGPAEIGSATMKHSPGFLRLVDDAKRNVRETTVPVVAERLERGDKFHFVDVREDDEWRAGHARGAIHVGKGVIERDIEAKLPDKGEEIILYCGGGFRSALAAEALQKMGYTNVFSMDGGMRAWREAGLPEDK
jgi:rhodanese-related sulfurtransferase